MLLSVPERILLLDVLPPKGEGPFLFLRAVRLVKEALGFSEEEAAELNLKKDGQRVTWDTDKNPMKEIEIGPVVMTYISDSIQASPSLHEEHIDFYARFVGTA